MTEQQTDQQPAAEQGHDQDTHDGEAECLHCVLAKAFLDWAERNSSDGVDPAEVGGAIGQFMTEVMLTMGDAEHRAEFRNANMAAQMIALHVDQAEGEVKH